MQEISKLIDKYFNENRKMPKVLMVSEEGFAALQDYYLSSGSSSIDDMRPFGLKVKINKRQIKLYEVK